MKTTSQAYIGAILLAVLSLEASTWALTPQGLLGAWLYLLPDLAYLLVVQPAAEMAPFSDALVYFAQSLALVRVAVTITRAIKHARDARRQRIEAASYLRW